MFSEEHLYKWALDTWLAGKKRENEVQVSIMVKSITADDLKRPQCALQSQMTNVELSH